MDKNTSKLKWGKVFSGIKIWVCGLFIVVYVSMLPEYINGQGDMSEFFIMIALMIICGIIFIKGIEQSMLVKNCKKYISILNSYQEYERMYVNQLSKLTNTSEEKIIKDIQKMIEKEYVYGISFDINTNEIIFSKKNFKNKNYINKEVKKIICSSCGGMNSAESKECEYCETSM